MVRLVGQEQVSGQREHRSAPTSRLLRCVPRGWAYECAPRGVPVALPACTVHRFLTRADARGRLSVVEGAEVPFPIRRVFFVADVVAGGERGGHAHRELHQFIVCQTGSLTVAVDDGREAVNVVLKPGEGLHIPPMLWAVEKDFAAGTVYLVLASHPYDERDYFRNRAEYLAAVGVAS